MAVWGNVSVGAQPFNDSNSAHGTLSTWAIIAAVSVTLLIVASL